MPLGTPLLAGPGAIVAVMLFVQRVHGVANGFALALAILAVAVAAWRRCASLPSCTGC